MTVGDEIRGAATMASLALALLVFFTNLRREALSEYLESVPPLGVKTLVGALPDLVLAVLTGGAVIAMAPLCFDSFQLDEFGHRAGVLPSMFGLIWAGFVCVLLFQLGIVTWRIVKALQAGS